MEELLASHFVRGKLLTLFRGQEVEGEVVAISDKEIVLDLGTKSEGIISTRDLAQNLKDSLQVADKIKAYVLIPENESGQVVLSLEPTISLGSKQAQSLNWAKFVSAQNQKSKLSGKVMEINKGGLIVEVAGVRGFLPNSQVGFELLTKSTHGLEDLIGQNLNVSVVEVDQGNNRLIFSQRGQVSQDILKKLKAFNSGQKVKNKCVAILPFGLVLDLDPSGELGTGGVEGFLPASKMDPDISYEVGKSLTLLIDTIDLQRRRINLAPFVTSTAGLIYK